MIIRIVTDGLGFLTGKLRDTGRKVHKCDRTINSSVWPHCVFYCINIVLLLS